MTGRRWKTPPRGGEPLPGVRITPEEARLLAELVQEHCGVVLGGDAGFLIERRLGGRLAALSLSSYLDYFHYLSYAVEGPGELAEFVERVTTHETYFFREQFQLDSFQREILPMLVARRMGLPLAVWSAGCSTGEEAYTIAMLVAESTASSVRVIGTDISQRGTATAEQAVYGTNSFRTTSDELRERYFEPVSGGYFRVREAIRRTCTFIPLNLLDTARFERIGAFDAIFCRNVLMYLSTQARRRIVEGFYDVLVPGGFLLLGHSESLINVSTRFDLVNLSTDLVYRRPI